LLLPHAHRKSPQADPRPRLGTPDQVRRSEERDEALSRRAERRRKEIAVERDRFELTRDKIVFCFELVAAAVLLVVLISQATSDPGLLRLLLLGGGGLGGVATLVRRRSASS